MENPIKMDDLGYPQFLETPRWFIGFDVCLSPASTASRPKRSKVKVVNRTCVSLVGHF